MHFTYTTSITLHYKSLWIKFDFKYVFYITASITQLSFYQILQCVNESLEERPFKSMMKVHVEHFLHIGDELAPTGKAGRVVPFPRREIGNRFPFSLMAF